VAEKVIVKTRRAGLSLKDGVIWESKGTGEFSIEQIEKKDRGTEVILHLRTKKDKSEQDDEKTHDDLLSHWKLNDIISKYSDHINIPIMMKKKRMG